MTHPDLPEIRDLLAQGFDPHDIAMELVDRDVARGDYEGCSSELEIAAGEYIALASVVLVDKVRELLQLISASLRTIQREQTRETR